MTEPIKNPVVLDVPIKKYPFLKNQKMPVRTKTGKSRIITRPKTRDEMKVVADEVFAQLIKEGVNRDRVRGGWEIPLDDSRVWIGMVHPVDIPVDDEAEQSVRMWISRTTMDESINRFQVMIIFRIFEHYNADGDGMLASILDAYLDGVGRLLGLDRRGLRSLANKVGPKYETKKQAQARAAKAAKRAKIVDVNES